jgi:hypothetical protein
MNILCHRGFWLTSEEKNSLVSFERAFSFNYGVETDIRDFNDKLVVSHDIPTRDKLLYFEDFLELYNQSNGSGFLALNIKSDGLQSKLKKALDEYQIQNYFVFDMSLPDTLGYIKNKFVTAIRLSEYEQQNSLFEFCEYIWLDSFVDVWYNINFIDDLISKGKKVVVVSSELHKRAHLPLWELLRKYSWNNNIYLCTDFVDEAERFFHGN